MNKSAIAITTGADNMETYMKNLTAEASSRYLDAFPDEFINLSEDKQQVALAVYRQLALGRPVSLEAVAAQAALSLQETEGIIAGWPGVYRDDAGAIVGFWGLSVSPMPHTLKVGDQTLYGWCAWDTLFLPQLIGQPAVVTSQDPLSKTRITLSVTPDSGVTDIMPRGAMTSFLLPDADELRTDVVNSFCHYIHFFESLETATRWVQTSEKSADLAVITIEDAYALGLRKNERQFAGLQLTEAA